MSARRVQISLDESLVKELDRWVDVRRLGHARLREACTALNVAPGCR